MSAFRAGEELDVVRGRLVVFLLELDVLAERDVGDFHRIEADQLEIRAQLGTSNRLRLLAQSSRGSLRCG